MLCIKKRRHYSHEFFLYTSFGDVLLRVVQGVCCNYGLERVFVSSSCKITVRDDCVWYLAIVLSFFLGFEKLFLIQRVCLKICYLQNSTVKWISPFVAKWLSLLRWPLSSVFFKIKLVFF